MVYGLKVRLDWIVFGKMEIENAMLPLWDQGFVTFIVVSSSIMICMYASKSQTKWPPRNLKYGNLFRRRQELDQYFFLLVYFVLHDLIMSSLFGRLNANGRLYSIALKFSFIWSIAPQVHASKEDKRHYACRKDSQDSMLSWLLRQFEVLYKVRKLTTHLCTFQIDLHGDNSNFAYKQITFLDSFIK